MNATTKNDGVLLNEKLTLDTIELMQALSCGRQTAIEIGMAAKARCAVGNKRVLWNTSKLKAYLDSISE